MSFLVWIPVVHEHLECGGGIAKPEEHDSGLENPHRGNEGSLSLIFFLSADVVVSPSNVKLSEQGGLLHIVNEFWDEGERIGIVDGVGVQVVIVLTWMQCSVLLWYKEQGGGL